MTYDRWGDEFDGYRGRGLWGAAMIMLILASAVAAIFFAVPLVVYCFRWWGDLG